MNQFPLHILTLVNASQLQFTFDSNRAKGELTGYSHGLIDKGFGVWNKKLRVCNAFCLVYRENGRYFSKTLPVYYFLAHIFAFCILFSGMCYANSSLNMQNVLCRWHRKRKEA